MVKNYRVTSPRARALECFDFDKGSSHCLSAVTATVVDMNIFYAISDVADPPTALTYLRNIGLLKDCRWCEDCSEFCTQVKEKACIDQYIWRCRHCRKKHSVREGSFFSRSKLTLQTLYVLIYFWVYGVALKSVATFLSGEVCYKRITDWYNFCRDICSQDLIINPVQLGGVGDIVEIDESKWGRKRKYHRGAVRNEGGPWIFGAIERRRSMAYMFVVHRITREEIMPHILRSIAPGTIIHSDQYRVYNVLPQQGYHHETVNHSVTRDARSDRDGDLPGDPDGRLRLRLGQRRARVEIETA